MKRFLTYSAVTSLLLSLAATATGDEQRSYQTSHFGMSLDDKQPAGMVKKVDPAKPTTAAPQLPPGAAPAKQTPPPVRQLARPIGLQPAFPDLVIEQLTSGAGTQRPALVTVRNTGSARSAATSIKIGCQAVGGSSNCQVGQAAVASIGPLAPGASTTVTVPLTALAKGGQALHSAGVRACADSSNGVAETNENNNCREARW
jgi:hypothetical protein